MNFSDGENLALLKKYKAGGIPVVSIFLTGRPLWVNPHINASDAFVVAWLPGTEGEGVADVLIANADKTPRHDFTGRLSFSWPANGSGEPINSPADPAVQWPFGYGLSYASHEKSSPLSENPGLESAAESFDGKFISRGDAANPFSFYLGDSSNLNTPAESLVSSSLGNAVSTRGVDYKAQEDAREITWSGTGRASAYIRSRRAIDVTKFGAPKDMAINITWRIDERPDGPFELSMGCGEGCSGAVDLTSKIASLKPSQWSTTAIPLRCFIQAGLDPAKVNTPLKLTSLSKGRITIHAAEINKAPNIKTCP